MSFPRCSCSARFKSSADTCPRCCRTSPNRRLFAIALSKCRMNECSEGGENGEGDYTVKITCSRGLLSLLTPSYVLLRLTARFGAAPDGARKTRRRDRVCALAFVTPWDANE